jgi:predicted DNA-binding protein (MmcQ/YjbR family)
MCDANEALSKNKCWLSKKSKMNLENIRAYCLQKDNVEESFPFGPDTLVFKVNNKLFLLIGLDTETNQFNVKCDPNKAIELREEFPDNILPGYHMNKKHWNTIIPNGLKQALLKEMIDDSYNLVAKIKK